MQNPQDVQLAAKALSSRLPSFKNAPPPIGLVLGTGLSGLVSLLQNSEQSASVPFSELPSFPVSTVASHAGKFVFGFLNSTPVLAQAGRFHLYEGYGAEKVCMGVRVMGELGVKTMILTNAAGSLNPLFPAGSLMCLSDMINHTGVSPLTGPNHDPWGPRFPDMGAVFSQKLQSLAASAALALAIPLYRGVYIGVRGPELETPAETRMYRQWGADAVGMSTVLEATACHHMGMDILAFSCLTNQNLPDCPCQTDFEEITAAAARCGASLGKLIAALAPELHKESGPGGSAA